MNRAVVRTLHAVTLVCGGSGLVLGWFRWLAAPVDDLSVVVPPAETWSVFVHLTSTPVFLMLFGFVVRDHVVPRWRDRAARRRATGIVLAALLLPVALSGPLEQVLVEETARRTTALVHLLTGTLWVAIYAVHVLAAAKWRARRPSAGD